MTKKFLKTKITAASLFFLFAALAPMQMMAQKRVLFICNSAFNPTTPVAGYVATSSNVEADPFIKLLRKNPTLFTVTTITTADGVTSVQKNGQPDITALLVNGVAASSSPANIAAFYANYDLLVTQESFGSGLALWKPAGLLGIKNITIPVIYTKGFALRNGLALTDVKGTPANNEIAAAVLGSKLAITVSLANQSNPLFTGINFSGGTDVAIFKKLASDAGLADNATTSIKAVDQIYNVNITNIPNPPDLTSQKTNTLLASIDPTAAPIGGALPAVINPDALACVNDFPGGTYFGTGTDMLPTTSRMIFFAYNYGALALGFSDGTTSNVTDAGLRIFMNAALILTNQSVATPTVTLGVNDNTLESDGVTVTPNPTKGIVTVNGVSDVKTITVLDLNGKTIVSKKNTTSVDLSNQAPGLYFVKVQTEKGSTTKKIVVE
jgi:hypothetical protein